MLCQAVRLKYAFIKKHSMAYLVRRLWSVIQKLEQPTMSDVKAEGVQKRVVGGVDTHKDLHVAAVVDELDRVLANEFLRRHGMATNKC